MRTLAALTALLLGTASSSALSGTYIGTVGNLPIVAQFGEINAWPSDRYYYRRVGQDIGLEPKLEGKRVTITERSAFPDNTARAIFTGTLENGVLRGTYKTISSGQTLPFSLRPASSADFKLPFQGVWLERLKRSDPYTALKFNQPLLRGKYVFRQNGSSPKNPTLQNITGRLGGVNFYYLAEPLSQVAYPRLEGAAYAKVNAALEAKQFELASSALSCTASADGKDIGGYDQQASLAHVDARLVSVKAEVSFYCGGAHPDNYTDTLTLEAGSGKTLKLEELYRFAPVPSGLDLEKQEPAEVWEKYAAARKAVLEKLVYAARPDLRKGDNAECYAEDSGLDAFKELSWWLSPQGLVVQADFPHVAAACEVPVTLPYKTLERYRASALAPR